jgi:hypothetical protein
MTQQIVPVAGGVLVLVREDRKLLSARFVDESIAYLFTEETD